MDQRYQEGLQDLIRLVQTSELAAQITSIFPIERGGCHPAIHLSKACGFDLITDESTITAHTLLVCDRLDSPECIPACAGKGGLIAAVSMSDTVIRQLQSDHIAYLYAIQTAGQTAQDATTEGIEAQIRNIIQYIGEDPKRPGLLETPARIARMYHEIFRGYDPAQKPKITTFDNEDHVDSIVFDCGDYYSMCEHHMLPFFGRYYFAYLPLPDAKILGISKVARVVGYCAARLQLQERLAQDIVAMLSDALDNQAGGFAIVMKGTHLCKTMRGVKNNGKMSVSYFTGQFKTDTALRNEFYDLIKMNQD